MGLLDGGVNRIFGRAFAAIYLDGSLINRTLTDDGLGTITAFEASAVPIKYQIEQLTETQRASPDYRATDVRVFILDAGLTINSDSRLVLGGVTYRVAPDIRRDPANAYFDVRAVLQ